MKKRGIAAAPCLAMVLAILFTLSGCAASVRAEDLMPDIKANTVSTNIDISGEEDAVAVQDFAVRLFLKSAKDGKNTLISPLSVLSALAMTANGAEGKTLSQMEEVFGLTVRDLNEYLYAYIKTLPAGDKYKLSIANSIWFKDDKSFTVSPDFLQANADYYGAGLYKAPFDNTTLRDINNWVEDSTDGMIRDILDRIPEEAVMYLVNAIAFDAEWENVFYDHQVRGGVFTKEDGTEQEAEMMYCTEHQYLEDTDAAGFIKYYADRKYAFVALLPDEGISVSQYVDSLTGNKLASMLKSPADVQVNAAIPKFESECSVEMSDILKAMGMTDAFDGAVSDFSGIGSSTAGNIFISRVLHKTYIAVDEMGTKAGAAALVEMLAGGAMETEDSKTVSLDRPFVYMIIDCEANLPVFIGTVMDIEN
ncbi:MAG: Serpin (serine protease inhibitor) [Firmicutes bacterium ADurb.Bin182]|nr:MAG: Serpin (serine protease inhibitor) [Firmicutes bacterium ADurb.Bin182]